MGNNEKSRLAIKQVGFLSRLKGREKLACSQKKLVGFFKRFDTSCANVAVRFLAVFHVGNLLNVHLESSSGFTVRVAHVVARSLTFSAHIAYS